MPVVTYDAPTLARLSGVAINFSTAGDSTIIPGISGQSIRVFRVFLNVSDATNISFKDGSDLMTGALNFAANEGFVLSFDTEPWFVCSLGKSFVINQSGTAQISGRVYYLQS